MSKRPFYEYESNNIVIVPTVSFCQRSTTGDPPQKKPRLEPLPLNEKEGISSLIQEPLPPGTDNIEIASSSFYSDKDPSSVIPSTSSRVPLIQYSTTPSEYSIPVCLSSNLPDSYSEVNQTSNVVPSVYNNVLVAPSNTYAENNIQSLVEIKKSLPSTSSWASNYLTSIGERFKKHIKINLSSSKKRFTMLSGTDKDAATLNKSMEITENKNNNSEQTFQSQSKPQLKPEETVNSEATEIVYDSPAIDKRVQEIIKEIEKQIPERSTSKLIDTPTKPTQSIKQSLSHDLNNINYDNIEKSLCNSKDVVDHPYRYDSYSSSVSRPRRDSEEQSKKSKTYRETLPRERRDIEYKYYKDKSTNNRAPICHDYSKNSREYYKKREDINKTSSYRKHETKDNTKTKKALDCVIKNKLSEKSELKLKSKTRSPVKSQSELKLKSNMEKSKTRSPEKCKSELKLKPNINKPKTISSAKSQSELNRKSNMVKSKTRSPEKSKSDLKLKSNINKPKTISSAKSQSDLKLKSNINKPKTISPAKSNSSKSNINNTQMKSVIKIKDDMKDKSSLDLMSLAKTSLNNFDLRSKLTRKTLHDYFSKINKKHLGQNNEERENLIITVQNNNENAENTKADTEEKPKQKKIKKLRKKVKNIKLVIQVICDSQSSDSEQEEEDTEDICGVQNEDLSFLDDFNIDEIVDTLCKTDPGASTSDCTIIHDLITDDEISNASTVQLEELNDILDEMTGNNDFEENKPIVKKIEVENGDDMAETRSIKTDHDKPITDLNNIKIENKEPMILLNEIKKEPSDKEETTEELKAECNIDTIQIKTEKPDEIPLGNTSVISNITMMDISRNLDKTKFLQQNLENKTSKNVNENKASSEINKNFEVQPNVRIQPENVLEISGPSGLALNTNVSNATEKTKIKEEPMETDDQGHVLDTCEIANSKEIAPESASLSKIPLPDENTHGKDVIQPNNILKDSGLAELACKASEQTNIKEEPMDTNTDDQSHLLVTTDKTSSKEIASNEVQVSLSKRPLPCEETKIVEHTNSTGNMEFSDDMPKSSETINVLSNPISTKAKILESLVTVSPTLDGSKTRVDDIASTTEEKTLELTEASETIKEEDLEEPNEIAKGALDIPLIISTAVSSNILSEMPIKSMEKKSTVDSDKTEEIKEFSPNKQEIVVDEYSSEVKSEPQDEIKVEPKLECNDSSPTIGSNGQEARTTETPQPSNSKIGSGGHSPIKSPEQKKKINKPGKTESKLDANIPACEKSIVLKLQEKMLRYWKDTYITSAIHKGRFSKIFQCKNSAGQNFAVKVLRKDRDLYSHGVLKENMMTALQKDIPRDNLHLVYFLNGFALTGSWCFFMEYYPKNLAQVLQVRNKAFHINKVQYLSRQLVAAVTVLRNNNVIHADIKPAHVLLDHNCNNLKLCGFDCAYYMDYSAMPVLPPSVSTVNYRAPEILLGYNTGYGIDVWSTALVMYEMATARQLFPGKYNNDILFKQMCTLGYIPVDMIKQSVLRHKHFIGTMFKRRTGPLPHEYVIRTENQIYDNRRIEFTLNTSYTNFFEKEAPRKQKFKDLAKIRSFYYLLKQMLAVHPHNRLPIEFVFANPFLHDVTYDDF